MDTDNKKNLEFHIEADDYFATLATLLNFVRDEVTSQGSHLRERKILQQKVDELMYLQDYYKIVPKTQKSKKPHAK